MKSLLSKLIILISILSVFKTYNVYAEDKQLTCFYEFFDADKNNTSLLVLFDISENKDMKYEASFNYFKGKQVAQQKKFEKKPNLEADLKEISEKGECPLYAMVYKGWVKKRIYISKNRTDLENIVSTRARYEYETNYVILRYVPDPCHEKSCDDPQAADPPEEDEKTCEQQAYDDISARVEQIKNDIKDFKKMKCASNDDSCDKEQERINAYIEETESLQAEYKAKGCILSNDDYLNRDVLMTLYDLSEQVEKTTAEWERPYEGNIDFSAICYAQNIPRTLQFIGIILYIIKVLVPVIIIGFGILDIAKVVVDGKDEELKKSAISLIKRVAIGIAIFFIPGTVNFILNNVSKISTGQDNINGNYQNCYNCILDPGKCEK